MSELFLKILNMSISAGWIVLAVVFLRLVLRKAPRWSIVALWGIVALRLVLPVSIESVLSLIPSGETVSPDVMLSPMPSIQTGIPMINDAINPIIGNSFAPNPGDSVNPLQVWTFIAAVVWIIGVVAMVLYAAVSSLLLRRRVATAVRVRENIYVSEWVQSPFVFGLLHPRIYLPSRMDVVDADFVIAHEQAHIRRRDHWWKPLGFVLLSMYWFHPILWAAYILLCRDIEVACDEKVIGQLGKEQRADYSQALLSCSIRRVTIAACPLAFGEVGVKERVKNVLNYKKPAFWIILVAVIVCIAVAVCFLTDPVTQDDKNEPQINEQPTYEKVPGHIAFFYPISMMTDEWQTGTFQLNAFPDVTFKWGKGKLETVTKGEHETLFEIQNIYNLAASDLNLDGYPEICATLSSEVSATCIVVYDYKTGKTYRLEDTTGEYRYLLYVNSDYLMCNKYSRVDDRTEQVGRLLIGQSGELILSEPWEVQKYTGKPVIWFDKQNPDSPIRGEVTLDAFPDLIFHWDYRPGVMLTSERLMMLKDGVNFEVFAYPQESLPLGQTYSVYVADITGDGQPDICANVYYAFSGLSSFNAVYVYDVAKDTYYMLADAANSNRDTIVSYYVRIEENSLVCDKIHVATKQTLATGELKLVEETKELQFVARKLYENPMKYIFTGEHIWNDRVTLTICADGKFTIYFNPKLNEDGTANWAQGMYTEIEDRLIIQTEDGKIFSFETLEDGNLQYLQAESDPLPLDCPMADGGILEKTPFYPE